MNERTNECELKFQSYTWKRLNWTEWTLCYIILSGHTSLLTPWCSVPYRKRQRGDCERSCRRWRRAGRCCRTTTWCRRPASTRSPASWQHLWAVACTTVLEAAGQGREETARHQVRQRGRLIGKCDKVSQRITVSGFLRHVTRRTAVRPWDTKKTKLNFKSTNLGLLQ